MNKRIRQYAKYQEYRVRDRVRDAGLKADRVPLSGACALIGKGVVVVEGGKLLIDHKSTIGKKQIIMHRSDLEKIHTDANLVKPFKDTEFTYKLKTPDALGAITFSYKSDRTLYIALPLDYFLKIYEVWLNYIIHK